MALIRRLSRLVTADVHAVLDQLEDPATLLKQAIREMEEALENQQNEIADLAQRRDALLRRARELADTPRDVDAKLDIAFEAGDLELAKRLTRRKLEAEKLLARLADKRAAIDDELAHCNAELAESRERLEGMRQKAECFDVESAPSRRPAFDDDELTVGDDELEAAFLRERSARTAR
jgi:phage shock protein A